MNNTIIFKSSFARVINEYLRIRQSQGVNNVDTLETDYPDNRMYDQPASHSTPKPSHSRPEA